MVKSTTMGSEHDGRIFVAGDVHLGADNADAGAFDDFLDTIRRETTGRDRFVLLGDVWDLVRRDPFGCAFETSETITRIKRLSERIPVHSVLGNHDACLSNLDVDRYDVQFHDQHVLESGGERIRFCHGQSFDAFHSEALSNYLSGPGDRGDIDPTRGRKDPVVAKGREVLQGAKRHLRTAVGALQGRDEVAPVAFPRRERRAHAYLETIPEDKLVFGHTHAPYVHPDNVVANPGSWKTTAPVHNTYLVIEDGNIELFRHRAAGVNEPLPDASVVRNAGAGRGHSSA